MALFKRGDLKNQGMTDEQIEYIMTESNRSLSANYTLTSDVHGMIDAAVQAARNEPSDPKNSPEYLELQRERDMLRTIGGDEFAAVKPKFREQVFGMLDRGEKAKPIGEQLTGISEKYEEYFTPKQEPAPQKPTFGAPIQGSMPTGEEGNVTKFEKAWGFTPQK